MNTHLQHFMDSFTLKKDFLYFFLADLITFSLIFISFSWFAAYLQRKSVEVMQGKSIEELQQLLSSSSPEQVLPFLSGLRYFLIWAVVGIVLLAVFSFFLYSLSRAVIWNHVHHQQVTKRTYWRWNLLNLSLLIPLVLFGLVLFIVKIFVALIVNLAFSLAPVFFALHSTFAENFKVILNGAVSFYLTLSFLVLVFMVYYAFSQQYKVWDSVGKGFSLFRKNWKTLRAALLFATVIALALSLVGIVVKRSIYSPNVLLFFNLALASAFLAWLRLYVLKGIVHDHHH